MPKKALFLDRDGVINVDHGYVAEREHCEFIDGIFPLVAAAKKAGYFVVVATNQSGIGRGYYTEAQFHILTQWMEAQFASRDGAIDAVYFCPYHAEHGQGAYKCHSPMRKPEPGMLLQAAEDHDIDLSASLLVGDSLSDIQAGLAAGVGRLVQFGPKKAHPQATPVSSLVDVIPML